MVLVFVAENFIGYFAIYFECYLKMEDSQV